MKKKLLSIVGLCFIVCLSIAMFTPDLYAQGDSAGTKANDKNLATKRGVKGSLADSKGPRKVFDPDTGQMITIKEEKTGGPSKMQMGIGLGSIPVAYMVLKYL